jgi:hypothetical protein
MGAPLSGGEAPQQAAGERDATTPPSDPGRLNDSRRFTIKSPTSFTSPIQHPQQLLTAEPPASAPLQFRVAYPK